MDLNISPYYDDFDETKNFLRMLFIPRRAVQARELTQLQSLLQNQIGRLSSHVFVDGTSIIGSRVKIDFDKPFIEVADVTGFVAGQGINKNGDLDVRGTVTSVDAINNLIYYNIDSGDFAAADTVEVSAAPSINEVVIVRGSATFAAIEPGLVYVGGSFVAMDTQEIIVEAEGNTGDYVIGYTFDEDIVTHETDQTLLDPANGSFNFLAPGAARYRGQGTLVAYTEGSTYADNFYQVSLIRGGQVITKQDKVQYADLIDLLARRTFDESGNYSVKEFPIILEEHDSDPTKIKIGLEAGKAYVLGYEQETIATTEIDTDKAREIELINNSNIYADIGPYIEVADDGTGLPNITGGIFDVTTKEIITLYSDNPPTNILGTARITSLIKGPNNRHRIYLSEVSGITALLTSVKSINNVGGTLAVTRINPATSLAYVGNSAKNVPIFPLSLENVKTFSDVQYDFVRSFTGVTVAANSATIIAPDDVSDFGANVADIMLITEAGIVQTGYSVSGTSPSSTGTPGTITITGLNVGPIDVIIKMHKRVGSHKTKTLVPNQLENFVSAGATTYNLANVDIQGIVSITQDPAGTPVPLDVSLFTLNNGIQDYYYKRGSITGPFVNAEEYDIVYSYFQHSGAGDYFSVDSYNISLYDSIPTYTSKDGAAVFTLRDCIDFRRSIDDLAGGTNLVYPGDNISLDYEFYLSRIDKVYIDQYGKFGVTKGVASRFPDIPNDVDNSMTLYVLRLPAYTFAPEDISVQLIENKNYTMRDIGSLENRIESLEYYTALSLLEKETADLSVTDVYGLDKFKNGIVVDDFSGHGVGDVYHEDYNCAIDPENGILRTPVNVDSIDFEVTDGVGTLTTKNMKVHDHIATLDYTTAVLVDQPHASTFSNVNPYNVFLWVGSMTLNPPSDNWVEINRLPAVVTNVAGANDNMRTLAARAGFLGTRWNSWNTIWSGRAQTPVTWNWWGQDFNTTRTINRSTQQRVGTTIRVVPGTIRRSLGDRVVDTSIIPFMRSRDVGYSVTGMKPNMTLIATFDGVDVSDQCTNLITDDAGSLVGTFTIPDSNNDAPDNRKFRTGSKVFRLADWAVDPTTSAEEQFTASGLLETKQRTIVAIENPRIVQSTVVQTRNVDTNIWSDPIAESFLIDNEGGVFLSDIDIFFKSKASLLPVTLFIVEMENGIPTQRKVPFSEASLIPSQVTTSIDGSVATKFTFSDPVYLQDNTEYSFVITSNSDEYEVFVADIGGVDLISGNVIAKQPYAGVMFSSQNSSTWTPDQAKDIKFKMSRCVFDTGSIGSLDLNSETGLDGLNATTIMFNIDTMILNNTDIGWQYKFTNDPSLIDFPNKTNIEMSELKSITTGPLNELKVTATFASGDDAISPVINLNRASAVMVENIIDGSDAGTYLTRTITLENPSDDLRVLIDAILPGSSSVDLYFKTSEAFTSRSVTSVIGSAPEEEWVGRTQYIYEDVGLSITPIAGYPTVSVTKVLPDGGDDRIFLKDITDYDSLVVGRILITFEDDVAPASIDQWPTGAVVAGTMSYYPATGGVYIALTDNSDNPDNTETWKQIGQVITNTISANTEAAWRPMKLESSINPVLDVGNEFIEYTYVPDAVVDEEFSSFAVKIELNSVGSVNTPFVKAFRALAVY